MHELFYLSGEFCIFGGKSVERMGLMTQSSILPVTSPNVHQFQMFKFLSPENWMINLYWSNPSQRKCLAVLPCDLSLITIHISDCCQFSDIHLSQGSVATYLTCGGIFKHEFVANLQMSQPVKEFWKSINIWGSYGQEYSVLFFLTHGVVQVNSTSVYFSSVRAMRTRLEITDLRQKWHVSKKGERWRRLRDLFGCMLAVLKNLL